MLRFSALTVTTMWLALLAGCHSMHPVQPSLASGWERVWVTRPDHSTVIIHAPEVRGDTLAGFIDGIYREMPLSDAVAMAARERAPGRTAALVLSGGAATFALLLYFGNRSYVGTNAQTCATGLTTGDVEDNLPVACCKVQPDTPC